MLLQNVNWESVAGVSNANQQNKQKSPSTSHSLCMALLLGQHNTGTCL